MKYYAVYKGNKRGVFKTWDQCNESINGYNGAIFKKFYNLNEAKYFAKYGKEDTSPKTFNNLFLPTSKQEIKNTIKKVKFIPEIYVYTDGACTNNGKDNAKAGIGVYFGKKDKRNISKQIEGKQTNNCAELLAVIEACNILKSDIDNNKNIVICTDSQYVINCCRSYGSKCENNNWNGDIPNKKLVKLIYNLCNKDNIKLLHVKAHTSKSDEHSLGNVEADKLANKAIGYNMCPYNKIYLNVPFKEKDIIKSLGGKWDNDEKKWYIMNNLDENKKKELLDKFSIIND